MTTNYSILGDQSAIMAVGAIKTRNARTGKRDIYRAQRAEVADHG